MTAARKLEPDTVIGLLREYEGEHDVANYRAYGWHVWPLVRNYLGVRLLGNDTSGSEGA